MGVCRRIVKEFTPSELTISVTIWSVPRQPPKFEQWEIKNRGCPPRIIPCTSRNTFTSDSKPRRRVARKKKEKSPSSDHPDHSEKPLLHSDSATLIGDDVAQDDGVTVTRERHVSVTSMDSVAGLGMTVSDGDGDDVAKRKTDHPGGDGQEAFTVQTSTTSESDDVKNSNSESIQIAQNPKSDDVDTSEAEAQIPKIEDVRSSQKLLKKSSFDLLSNGDVTMEMAASGPRKPVLRQRKKVKSPSPRYREFTETSINMYIEMNKQNIGEFVWDQQCTRIDALVAPIVELDRTTTPEIPQEIHVFD